jgi:hypothetical protein
VFVAISSFSIWITVAASAVYIQIGSCILIHTASAAPDVSIWVFVTAFSFSICIWITVAASAGYIQIGSSIVIGSPIFDKIADAHTASIGRWHWISFSDSTRTPFAVGGGSGVVATSGALE